MAALHLQGETAQPFDPDGEVQLNVTVAFAPLVIAKAPAVAASQGFVNLSFRSPLRYFATTWRKISRVHSHGW